MRTLLTLATLFILGSPLYAQQTDQNSYCKFVEESAKATGVALESPTAVTGLTPNQGIAPQVILGLETSVNSIRKGRLTVEVARKNCELYRDSTTVQQRITYDMPALNQDALLHRLTLITRASVELDSLIAENERILAAGNIPRQSVYLLEKQRLTLELDKQSTEVALAQIYVPHLSVEPLTELAAAEAQANTANQDAQLKLTRLSNWDLNLQGGTEKPLQPFNTSPRGYAGFTLVYSLGSASASRHDIAAITAFDDWQRAQIGGVIQSIQVFHGIVNELIAVQTAELARLRSEESKIDESQAAISTSDTSTARAFRNQLTADSLILRVQIQDTEFRLARLETYAKDNF